jgi:tetratricopeptide (TPR) repeat protein
MRYLWIYLVPLFLGGLAVHAADRARAAAETVRSVYLAGIRLEQYRLEHGYLPKDVEETPSSLSISIDAEHNSYTVATRDQSVVLRDGKLVRAPELPAAVSVVFAEEEAQLLTLLRAAHVQGLLDELKARVNADDYEGAFAKYQEVLAADPKFSDSGPLFSIGWNLARLRKPELVGLERKILPLVRAAFDAERPPDYSHAETVAGLLVLTGDVSGARAAIDRYAAQSPADLKLHLLRVRWAPRLADVEAAIRAVHEAIAAAGDDPQKLYTAGITGCDMLRNREHLTNAHRAVLLRDSSQALSRAAEIKPDFYEALSYGSIVLRIAAEEEGDPAKKQALVARADQMRQRAVEIIQAKKKKAAP